MVYALQVPQEVSGRCATGDAELNGPLHLSHLLLAVLEQDLVLLVEVGYYL